MTTRNLVPVGEGNQLAVTHGTFSALRMAPRAEAIADDLRSIVPASSASDEPTIRLLALTLAQVEAATAWVAQEGIVDKKGQPQPILRHLGTMTNTAARLCSALGLTPTSRAQLGLDLTRARGEALREHLAAVYGGAGPDAA